MATSSIKDHVALNASGGDVAGNLERFNPNHSFFVASLILDGSATMIHSLVTIDMTTILSLMYLAFVATIVGYGIWGRYWDAMKPGGLHRYRYWCP